MKADRTESFVDPTLPPSRILVVPDLNAIIDVAYESRRANSVVLSFPTKNPDGSESDLTISLPTGRPPTAQSVKFFESLAVARFSEKFPSWTRTGSAARTDAFWG